MDIQIIEAVKETLQVIIKCSQVNDEVMRLKHHIESFDQKIQALKPELNRTIKTTMCNGEQLSISRKYVKALRTMLAIGGKNAKS
ncbi:MAG: hypothetical protein PUB10_01940 [Clostridiales bacterium]|nr:hypothetical protein [Clostridiales bacterium]